MKFVKTYTENGQGYEFTVKVELPVHGKQSPYLSVTGELWELGKNGLRRGRDCICCGCMHEDVIKHFPELAPLVAFHLAEVPGVPMHYIANAHFWYDKLASRSEFRAAPYDPPAIEAFKSTVAYGTVAGDESCPLPLMVDKDPHPEGGDMRKPFTRGELTAWLEARIPALCAEFKARCEAVGLKVPEVEAEAA